MIRIVRMSLSQLTIFPDFFTAKIMSPKTKRNISRIIPFGIIWLIFSLVYVQLVQGILGDSTTYPATGNPYHFKNNILVTPIVAFITAASSAEKN